ncbi:MAG: DsrE/DsrF/DrsH-like family protein [Nitrospirae bacterium]|nr:DsrE/DsrF/DrsH-like family protein [Nitrospirota bacterium]
MTTDAVQEKIKELEERLEKVEANRSNLTMVLFSGDFDKAFAAFIIANGALAMGKEVTIFVTFWGIDVLKKPTMTGAGKNFLEKMVTMMRPKGTANLPTSKMNFAGIGPKLFNYMMGKKNITSLQSLVDTSIEFGVKIVVCQMSMDVMGIKKEDLIDGLEFGGVAAFLGSSFNSNTTLFV